MKPSIKKSLLVLLPLLGLGLAYLLRIKLLMALSMVEFALMEGERLPPYAGTCPKAPLVAFHRGYALGDKYEENSSASIAAALAENVRALEIDVSIDGKNIMLGHDLKRPGLKLATFRDAFQEAFDLVIVDVKEVKDLDLEAAAAELRTLKDAFKKVIYIGRKCDLLLALAEAGEEVSCEALGLFAHKLLRLPYWSVDHRRIGTKYQSFLDGSPKLLLWTVDRVADVTSLCGLNPEIVLVDKF